MKDGFVRVGAISPRIRVADPTYNRQAAVNAAKLAAKAGVKVLALPELTLSGASAGDLFLRGTLLSACEKELATYIEETAALDLASFVGVPVAVGDRVYNCAAAIAGGRLLGLVPKTRLSGDSARDEERFFAAWDGENTFVTYAGQDTVFGTKILFETPALADLRIAVTFGDELSSLASPVATRALAGATLLVTLAAEAETVGAAKDRRALLSVISEKTAAAVIYAGAGEGESGADGVYAGHRLIAENGNLLAVGELFSDGEITYAEIDTGKLIYERRKRGDFAGGRDVGYELVDFDLQTTDTELSAPPSRLPFVPDGEGERKERCDLILGVQAHALAGRLERAHAKTAVLGLSGGLDSTLALLVAVKANDLLGRDRKDIVAVTMPAFGTTARTKGNAEKLAEAFGVTLRTIDIRRAVDVHFEDIGHAKDDYSVVYENAQARERTQVLMDIANGENGLVIGTGDLSELALGWSTYNGDHMSMYGVNCSVPKTLIRYVVANYAAEVKEELPVVAAVLEDVLATPVSPELLPPKDGEIAQRTEGIVGPYELHDYFLYHFIHDGASPKKLYRLACASFAGTYDKETVKGWLRLFVRRFFTQQFKRSCSPDGPKVGSVALSPRTDWKMPSDAQMTAFLAELDEVDG